MSKVALILCLSFALFASASVHPIILPLDDAFDANTAIDQLAQGVDVLMRYFDNNMGLWQDPNCLSPGSCEGPIMGWWYWGNALHVLADYQKVRGDRTDYSWAYDSIFNNNYDKMANTDYFDDEGWWGLALIQLYYATGDWKYVARAMDIASDMKNRGAQQVCGNAGIYWDAAHTQIGSIANELFISLNGKIRLADGDAGSNLDDAINTWNWLQGIGLIGGDNIIVDHFNVVDGGCGDLVGWTFTYTNGVILSGLVDMYLRSGEGSYLSKANDIARAAMARFTQDGYITDGNLNDKSGGGDGAMFKGIFTYNLAYLAMNTNDEDLKNQIIDLLNNNYNGLINNQGTGNLYAYAWSRGANDNNGADIVTHITSLYLLDAMVMINQ